MVARIEGKNGGGIGSSVSEEIGRGSEAGVSSGTESIQGGQAQLEG